MVVAGGGANQGKDLTSVEVFSECGLPLPHCTLPPPATAQVQCLHHFELPNIQYSLLPRSHFTLDGRSGRVDSLGRKQEWEQEQEELRLAVRRGLETVARTQARTSLLIRCLVMLLSPYEASVAPH